MIVAVWELYKLLGPADGVVIGGARVLPRTTDLAMPHVWDMVGRLLEPVTRAEGSPPLWAAIAVAALTTRPLEDLPCVVVPDVQDAFAALARALLDRRPDLTVIGVTGSSGKTSTKDLLASVLARDKYLPRQLATRGDRLALSNGIVLLAVAAIVLVVAFDAQVTVLIQLYIVGVFVAFTLSQLGMVRHWTRRLGNEQIPAVRRRVQRGLPARGGAHVRQRCARPGERRGVR